ncbi:hypothetical protein H4R18_002735 [Coemansia javaensis]|uniref:Arrestin-like N-terminal domain-containing protein n=1 Tax=Coemansia javaensis TaxID=2761396 RepID=A0A9W8HB92_9FUNG|nr:hypothetical protein H4R18_002735 [Coemansia javaensis]
MVLSRGRLQIILDTPDVMVSGPQRGARCAVLSGRVVYTARAPRAVASLVVRFRPRSEDLLNPALSVADLGEISCVVVRDGQVCAPAAAVPRSEADGRQEWRFSMGIPGSINETVFTPSAFVAYELAAEMRPAAPACMAAFCRQTCTVPVAVKRMPAAESQWATTTGERLDVAAAWDGRLELSLTAASRAVHDGLPLRVGGVIRPLAKGIGLLRAEFELFETASSPLDYGGGGAGHSRTVAACSYDTRAPSTDGMMCLSHTFPLARAPSRGGIAIDQELQLAGRLDVPDAYTGVQYDVTAGPIRVSHGLALNVVVVDAAGQLHKLRLDTAAFVQPLGRPSASDLPRYEHVDMDTLLAASRCSMTETVLPPALSALSVPLPPRDEWLPCVDSLVSPPPYSPAPAGIGAPRPATAVIVSP